jgi:sialate O-acetylesterase
MPSIRLNSLFRQGAVLQRNTPLPVWGNAAEEDRIRVTFQEHCVEVPVVGRSWRVTLPPLDAGGPFELCIEGDSQRVLVSDVYVGDVWLCSGQSNMEYRLELDAELSAAEALTRDASIRRFYVPRAAADLPLLDVNGRWTVDAGADFRDFSAVGYWFSRKIREHLPVPVGLIEAHLGSSRIESWLPDSSVAEVLEVERMHREQMERVENYRGFLEGYRRWKARGEEGVPPWVPPDPFLHRPGGLFHGMIAPLAAFPLCGVLWYQGESNTKDPAAYARLQRALIRDWRMSWNRADLPMYWVQLAAYNGDRTREEFWPELREEQRKIAMEVPCTGCVTAIDAGDPDDIHPPRKRKIGERLADMVLAKTHGIDLPFEGPKVRNIRRANGRIFLQFDRPLVPDAVPGGLELAGDSGEFLPANAVLRDRNILEVFHPGIPHPLGIRYAWAAYPEVTLRGCDGRPTAPFLMHVS